MVGLEILVLFAVVLFCLVILVVRRVGFSGKHVAAVLFVSHGGDHAACSPAGIQRAVPSSTACGNCHFGEYLGNFLRGAAVEQSGIHPADHARLAFIDSEDFLFPAETVRHFDLVVTEQTRREESSSAETPFQRKQNRLALHVAFLLRHHRKHKQNDTACLGQRIEIFLFKENPDGRIVILQGFYPADAVHQISGKSGHRFGDDHVDFPVHCVLHQLLKSLSVSGVCSRKTVIYIAAGVFPVGIFSDFLHILRDLQPDGQRLIDIVRGNAAIRRHAQNAVLLGRCSCRRYHADISAVKRINLPDKSVFASLPLRLKARAYR